MVVMGAKFEERLASRKYAHIVQKLGYDGDAKIPNSQLCCIQSIDPTTLNDITDADVLNEMRRRLWTRCTSDAEGKVERASNWCLIGMLKVCF